MEFIFGLKANVALDGGHEANLKLVAHSTTGDDIDSYGPLANSEKIFAEEVNIHLKNIFNEDLDLMFGRQDFKLGDGWLVADGYSDILTITRFSGSPSYFDGVDVNYQIKKDLAVEAYYFRLPSGYLQYDQNLSLFAGGGGILGTEIRYDSDFGDWALGAMRRHDKSRLRNETELFYLRYDKELAEDFDFHTEYAIQKGKTGMLGGANDPVDSNRYRKDAWALNTYVKKTFSDITYKPWGKLQYLHYSGDKQSSSKNENFEQLFFSWLDYGTGSGSNSNLIVYRVDSGFQLTDKLSVMVGYRDYYWDRLKPGFQDRHYATLETLVVNYAYSRNVYLGAMVNCLDPHRAASNTFGPNSDRTLRLAGVWMRTVF
jgi:hypothetical protein